MLNNEQLLPCSQTANSTQCCGDGAAERCLLHPPAFLYLQAGEIPTALLCVSPSFHPLRGPLCSAGRWDGLLLLRAWQQLKARTCCLRVSLTVGIKAIPFKCLVLYLVAGGCVGLLLATYRCERVCYLKNQCLANLTPSPHWTTCHKHEWPCFSFQWLCFERHPNWKPICR